MATWDDFQRQLDRTNKEIDKATEALEKMRVSFKSLTKTYQDFRDYCMMIGWVR